MAVLIAGGRLPNTRPIGGLGRPGAGKRPDVSSVEDVSICPICEQTGRLLAKIGVPTVRERTEGCFLGSGRREDVSSCPVCEQTGRLLARIGVPTARKRADGSLPGFWGRVVCGWAKKRVRTVHERTEGYFLGPTDVRM